MTDVYDKVKRSEVMRSVRSKNTKPELVVRRLLHRMGCRFRIHRKDLPGHPDIVLPKYRKIVFIHGCFWHQHQGCKRSARPASHADFWGRKLDRNVRHDAEVAVALKAAGWEVLVIWECQTENENLLR